METSEKSIDVLNDLIEINNDRVAGFEKASKNLESNDMDLKTIFNKYAEQSRTNSSELTSAVSMMGGDAEKGSSATGTIHRAWLDVKATFSGHDRKSVLQECERGEDAIKKAYRTALEDQNGLSFEASELIRNQQQEIDSAHNSIKALRDSQI